MIGWLGGIIRELDPSGLALVDVGGVGYEVLVDLQTLCRLQAGKRGEFFIHTHVREDQITLFGFSSQRDRSLFRQLTSVSGIGARMAMNIMSGMAVDDLLAAIDASDDAAIARIPGIGRKTAQRLILELRGKLVAEQQAVTAGSILGDVRSALLNLGYKASHVDAVLKSLPAAQDFETLLKTALKALA